MRTRLILILCPQLLWKRKTQKKAKVFVNPYTLLNKGWSLFVDTGFCRTLDTLSGNVNNVFIKTLCTGHLLDSCEGPQSYLLLVTVPQMTRVCVEASVD